MKSPIRFYLEALVEGGFQHRDYWDRTLPKAGCWVREQRARAEAELMDARWTDDPRFRGVRLVVQARETGLPGRDFLDLVDLALPPGAPWPTDLEVQVADAVSTLKSGGGGLAEALEELFPEAEPRPSALASLLELPTA